MCFDFLYNLLSETFLTLRRTERDMIKIVYWYSYQVPVIFVRFSCNFNILDSCLKNTQISNCVTFRPVGAELFHADLRMDGQT
jgi:hypothetical protein